MFTLEMLKELLIEEGFEIQQIDDYVGWQAIGVELEYGGGAVQIEDGHLIPWIVRSSKLAEEAPESDELCRIPLADPQCFEKVVAVLRAWK